MLKKPSPRRTLAARVNAIIPASSDAILIELLPQTPAKRWWAREASNDGAFPAAPAGAHIDLHFGGYVRQYSLCSPPGETHRYLICVRAEGGGRGGSTHIHNALRIGDQVQISPPRNHFPLGQAPKTVLLAGGIGVTPLLAMAETLSNRGQDFELHCFSSSTDRLALAAYIATRPLAGRTQFHVGGQASPSRAAIPATMAGHPAGTEFYVCGPAGFIETIIKHAVAAGTDPALLHSERFAPEPARPPGAKDRPFTVRIHGSGNTYPVPPEKTIAEVLLEQGLPLTLSCNQGMCGTCLTPVLAGTPEHRDTIQTPEEKASNNEIALCCSRASSQEITLQL